jgi:excisionase family DNA binding protein
MTSPLPRLLRAIEVATMLQCSVSKVYMLAAVGVLPSVKIGTQVRFKLSSIEAWIDEQEVERFHGAER